MYSVQHSSPHFFSSEEVWSRGVGVIILLFYILLTDVGACNLISKVTNNIPQICSAYSADELSPLSICPFTNCLHFKSKHLQYYAKSSGKPMPHCREVPSFDLYEESVLIVHITPNSPFSPVWSYICNFLFFFLESKLRVAGSSLWGLISPSRVRGNFSGNCSLSPDTPWLLSYCRSQAAAQKVK